MEDNCAWILSPQLHSETSFLSFYFVFGFSCWEVAWSLVSCDTSYFKEVSFKFVQVVTSAFYATNCLNLSARLKGFPKLHKLILLWITLHFKSCFDCPVNTANWALKFSALGNLYLAMIRLIRNFLVIEIVRCCTTSKASVFPYLLLFYWEFEPCYLRHTFSTVGH